MYWRGGPRTYAATVGSRGAWDARQTRRKVARIVSTVRSTFTTSTDESPIYGVQKTYVKFDFRAELAPPDDRWGVALIGIGASSAET
jgi:hypothetical protein